MLQLLMDESKAAVNGLSNQAEGLFEAAGILEREAVDIERHWWERLKRFVFGLLGPHAAAARGDQASTRAAALRVRQSAYEAVKEAALEAADALECPYTLRLPRIRGT